jgi:LysR family glycine cleavage system transcriptional activator
VLETSLGVTLFERRGRAIDLTDAGREYLIAAQDAFDLVEAAGRRVTGATRRVVLSVSVLPTFAMRWLIPRRPQFSERHPDIEVHLVTSIEPVDFERGEIDIAIRVGATPSSSARRNRARIDLQMVRDWKNVRADLLMPDVLVPVCSPNLLGRKRVPAARDLFALGLLHNATRSHAWPDWFSAQNVPYKPGPKEEWHGHFFMCLQAAVEGRGVALIPSALVEDDVDLGRLCVPFDHPVESAGDYYLLCRNQQWNTESIRHFREWILEASEPAP